MGRIRRDARPGSAVLGGLSHFKTGEEKRLIRQLLVSNVCHLIAETNICLSRIFQCYPRIQPLSYWERKYERFEEVSFAFMMDPSNP